MFIFSTLHPLAFPPSDYVAPAVAHAGTPLEAAPPAAPAHDRLLDALCKALVPQDVYSQACMHAILRP